uniref:ARAD1B16456p n=1 Tax=Blastobotrys adeninivorans TaxID=409370 RepID=A0A060TBK7_BLAAD
MMPPMPASKTFRKDLVKVKACIGCRRRKQGCDAADTFPAPCSRCEKRGAVCQIDSGGRSSRVHDTPSNGTRPGTTVVLAGEMSTMSSNVTDMKAPSSSSTTNSGDLAPPTSGATAKDDFPRPPSQQFSADPPFPVPDVELCGVMIPSEKQKALYRTYIDRFHDLFPVLYPQMLTVEANLNPKSRMVFWAMCTVASGIVHSELQRPLREYVQELLGSQFGRIILQSTRRALLMVVTSAMLSNFQIGSNSLQHDPGWLYSGLAVHFSLLLGLQSQNQSVEILRIHNISESSGFIAWIGSVVVNYELALFWGIPPTVQVQVASWRNFALFDRFTQELVKQANILCAAGKALDALSDLRTPAQASSRGLVASSHLESLKQLVSYMDPVIELTELIIAYSKLAIYSCLLLPGTAEEDLRGAIRDLFILSLQIPTTIDRLLQDGVAPKSLPVFVSRMVITSIVTLYKLLASPYQDAIDRDRALKGISILYQQFTLLRDPNGDATALFGFLNGLQSMYSANVLSPVLCSASSRRNSSVMFSTYVEYFKWSVIQNRDPFNPSEPARPNHVAKAMPEGGSTTATTATTNSGPNSKQNQPTTTADDDRNNPFAATDTIIEEFMKQEQFLWDWGHLDTSGPY